MSRTRKIWPGLVALLLVLAACGGPADSPAFRLAEAFPGADTVPGWSPAGEIQTFEPDSLYDLVNGQAESFFAYAFERVAVRDYQNEAGTNLRIAVWQVATPGNAYGLFTTYRAGTPVSIGRGGDADPGRRLDFWQDRYFVRLFARQPIPPPELTALAEAVAAALPRSPEIELPEPVTRLPAEGLVANSPIFFRQEISIQNQLWLGGENLLGLGPDTGAVLARYRLGPDTAQLLLVQYAEAEAAAAALAALQQGAFPTLVQAEAEQNWLGAVFGPVDEAQAAQLLAAGLR